MPADKRLCIAYLLHSFGTGGTERFVTRLANALDRSNFRPVVVSLTTCGSAQRWICQDDVEVHAIGKREGNDLAAVRRLSKLMRNLQVDLLQSHNWPTLWEATIARRCGGVRHHIHAERGTVLGDVTLSSQRRWLRGNLTRWGLAAADAVVSVAECTRDRLSALSGFPAQRIQVIPNGVEPPSVAKASRAAVRREMGIADDTVLLGSVGRLAEIKNFIGLLNAVQQIRHLDRRFRVVLVGDGPQRDALEAQVESLQLTDLVHLTGHRDDVGPWLAAMDAYVNCSHSEGISQGVLEALSLGLPQVVTDVGDHRRVVEGTEPCGIVVPMDDTAALATAIEQIVTDRDGRLAMAGSAGDRYRLMYNLPCMVRAYSELYRSVAAC